MEEGVAFLCVLGKRQNALVSGYVLPTTYYQAIVRQVLSPAIPARVSNSRTILCVFAICHFGKKRACLVGIYLADETITATKGEGQRRPTGSGKVRSI